MFKPTRQIREGASLEPKKSLGQHFLRSKRVLNQILAAAGLQKSDQVLEIGPGDGVLTRELAKRAGRVLVIEKDHRLIGQLKEEFKDSGRVEIVEGDALRLLPLTQRQFDKVVANLPFYAAVAIIRRLLESSPAPRLMVFMVQKEVGQRICAQPPEMSLLGNSVQFYAQAQIVTIVDKTSFWPPPRVDSAVIKLIIKDRDPKINKEIFFKILRAGFRQPRKQLVNNLTEELKRDKEKICAWLAKNHIRPEQRAESLSLDNWLSLTETFDPFPL